MQHWACTHGCRSWSRHAHQSALLSYTSWRTKWTRAPGPSLQDLPADRGEEQYAQAQNIESILSLCSQAQRGRSGSRSGSQMGGSSFASSSRFNIGRRSFAGSRNNLFSSSKQSLNTDASGRQLNRGGVKVRLHSLNSLTHSLTRSLSSQIFDSNGDDVTPLPLIESSEGSTTAVR